VYTSDVGVHSEVEVEVAKEVADAGVSGSGWKLE
jgi:hypothetical protein